MESAHPSRPSTLVAITPITANNTAPVRLLKIPLKDPVPCNHTPLIIERGLSISSLSTMNDQLFDGHTTALNESVCTYESFCDTMIF